MGGFKIKYYAKPTDLVTPTVTLSSNPTTLTVSNSSVVTITSSFSEAMAATTLSLVELFLMYLCLLLHLLQYGNTLGRIYILLQVSGTDFRECIFRNLNIITDSSTNIRFINKILIICFNSDGNFCCKFSEPHPTTIIFRNRY